MLLESSWMATSQAKLYSVQMAIVPTELVLKFRERNQESTWHCCLRHRPSSNPQTCDPNLKFKLNVWLIDPYMKGDDMRLEIDILYSPCELFKVTDNIMLMKWMNWLVTFPYFFALFTLVFVFTRYSIAVMFERNRQIFHPGSYFAIFATIFTFNFETTLSFHQYL